MPGFWGCGQAHNLQVVAPATNDIKGVRNILRALFLSGVKMDLVVYRLQ